MTDIGTAEIHLLKNCEIFSTLTSDEIHDLTPYMTIKGYSSGDIIIDGTSDVSCLYIVIDGEVHTKRQTDSRIEVDHNRYFSGDYMVELDIVRTRKTNVKAYSEKDSTVILFPNPALCTMDVVTENHPKIVAKIFHNLVAAAAKKIRQINRSVSDHAPWVNELLRQVQIDPLTGLYNNVFLESGFERKLKSDGDLKSILMIKPDNFKHINDTYGHDVGDKVLISIARVIESSVGEDEIPVRYKGDVFTVILPRGDKTYAGATAELLRNQIRNIQLSKLIGSSQSSITVSIGGKSWNGEAKEAAIAGAYSLMFAARNNGGDRVIIE